MLVGPECHDAILSVIPFLDVDPRCPEKRSRNGNPRNGQNRRPLGTAKTRCLDFGCSPGPAVFGGRYLGRNEVAGGFQGLGLGICLGGLNVASSFFQTHACVIHKRFGWQRGEKETSLRKELQVFLPQEKLTKAVRCHKGSNNRRLRRLRLRRPCPK